ncbi:hypothetical protein Gogos_010179 [Gossypium gossypioides]|uniref:Uncharacterized protein n=1 Tax=Gossypium gossypioides TaxID=34282 RepID=A0A7J9BKG6_GOSGO|nr:hypothetical protein [Gossypium gossypioides]
MEVVEPMIKHGHLLLVHSVVNFLRMLTMTYLKRMMKKIREMMFTF